MISEEGKAEIKRLHGAENWKVGAIARHLDIHPVTVKVHLERKNRGENKPRKCLIGPYTEFIASTLADYPELTATRMFQMVKERGYKGSVYPVRRVMKTMIRSKRRAYQDLHFFPGEAAQVDWADLGCFEISPGSTRRMLCFVMVLAYSRKIFARVYFDQKMGTLLEAHVESFDFFRGVPRKIIYDNMKTAVINNFGKGVQFNESLVQLAGHYQFELRACTPRAAWQKGRVERAIRYLRDNFSPKSRSFQCLEELNTQLKEWLQTTASERRWPDDSNKTVDQIFEEEVGSLLPNQAIFPFYDEKFCKPSKKSMVQFDCNYYSVPPEFVGQSLVVRATSGHINIYKDNEKIASHRRGWSKGQKIVTSEHIEAIIEQTYAAPTNQHRALIVKRLPVGEALIKAWCDIDENLQIQSRKLNELIKIYGDEAVTAASELALENETPRVDSIAHILQNSGSIPQPIQANFSRADLSKYVPVPHDLSIYDRF